MLVRACVCFMLLSIATLAPAGLALVGNENGGTVSLIDTARDEVVGEIQTGGKPRGTAITAAGSPGTVPHQRSSAWERVDREERALANRRAGGEPPEGVTIPRAGSMVPAAVELTNTVVFNRNTTRLKDRLIS